METPLKSELLEKVLKQDESSRSIARIEEVCCGTAVVAPGENYASDIQRIQVEALLGNGKRKDICVVVKEQPVNGYAVEHLRKHYFFDTEIKLYKEILPILEDVLDEHHIPPLWGRLLGHEGKYLIFTDLKKKNYRNASRFERLDLQQAVLSLNTLALLHAASVVLRRRGLLNESSLHCWTYFRSTMEMRKVDEEGLRTLAGVMENEWGPEWHEISQKVRRKADTIFDELREIGRVDEDRLNVLCHGDPWSANVMFKYSKATEQPIAVRFVDFQMSHYNSYACDLIYLIGISVRPDIRRTQMRLLLQSYTRVLGDTLHLYGLGHLAPSLATVEAEVKRMEPLYFFILISFMAVMRSPAKNGFNMDGLAEGKDDPYNPDIYRGTYKEEIDQELLYWAKTGYI